VSVRVRLGISFAILIGLFLVPVQYAGARLNDLRELAVERRSQHAAATLALGDLRAGLADFDSQQRAYLATLDTRLSHPVQATLRDLMTQRERLAAAGFRDVTEGLGSDLDSLAASSHGIDGLIRAGAVEEATRVFRTLDTLQTHVVAELARVAAAVDRESAADFARAERMSATAATTTVLTTLAAVLLALVVGLWTTRVLTRPLDSLSSAAARVADGAFEEPEERPYDRRDEIGALSRSFRSMTLHLAELDRMKGEFMSVASHELKTPINVIHGYTELLAETLDGDLTDRQRDILHAMVDQTDAMARLVNRLLEIGRLEAGTYGMAVEAIPVEDFVAGLARAFDPLADEAQVRLQTEIDASAPPIIRADPDMLRDEVLGNLLSNALRFTPAGGEVRVRVWKEAGDVVFEVADTGPGIPSRQRPHIFDKYYKGGRTRLVGAGLGLAVAKEVIEAHGGRIELVPEVQEGATFRVYLPAPTKDIA
jgi:signal transduction histidine kinase